MNGTTDIWSSYTYFPYARSGLSTLLADAPNTSRGQVSIDLTVPNASPPSYGQSISLYGPGDVARLDAAQVVRTVPTDGTVNHPPYYFPMIEFDRPELPWAFTPEPVTPEDDSGQPPHGARLRPWLTLIAVAADNATLTVDPAGATLPVLKVPLSELPESLDDAWAWAHVTSVGRVSADDLEQTAAGSPQKVISRLLCARWLAPYVSYVACVVPTYADGAATGLGQAPAGSLDPAWPPSGSSDPNTVSLPVYYHWTFTTGAPEDFETLARRLNAVQSPSAAGSRPMVAPSPGAGLPSPGSLRLQGAMSPTSPKFGPGPQQPFVTRLHRLLNVPAGASPLGQTVLAPPIYGRWQARVTELPPGHTWHEKMPWLPGLNLDPRNRAAAEFGAHVVRRQADALMASAWRQLGDLERANQALRQSQLARAGGHSIHKTRLTPRSSEAILALTAPVHGRAPLPASEQTSEVATVAGALAASALGNDAVGPAMRRLVRPRGPLARRFDPHGSIRIEAVIDALAPDSAALAPARQPPDGTQTFDVSWTVAHGTLGSVSITVYPTSNKPAHQTVSWSSLEQTVTEQQQAITTLLSQPDPAAPPATDVTALAQTVLSDLDPDKTVPARINQRLTVTDPHWHPQDPLEPMLAAPEFPTPLWEPLRRISQQLIVPGLEDIPPESITVLQTNSTFVNAFMVGANNELARQLVWRHFPTDQRATYFRQFWDPSAGVPGSADPPPNDPSDIPPIDKWPVHKDLDKVAGAETSDLLVLVVRGELLRRFPNASVYAVPSDGGDPPSPQFPAQTADAATVAAATATELYPRFQGQLDPDLSFFGFKLQASDADKWFFVLQQHPIEPRYGLEPADPGSASASGQTDSTGQQGSADQPTWETFSWTDLAGGQDPSTLRSATDATLPPAIYAPASLPANAQNIPAAQTDGTGPVWGYDAANMAAVTLRDPYRVAIHASALLDPS
jgi:hypothetical protein